MIGNDRLVALVAALGPDCAIGQRRRALDALAELGSRALAVFDEVWRWGADPLVQERVARVAAAMGPEVVPRLVEALHDDDLDLRDTACEALARLRSPEAVDGLVANLGSDVRSGRRQLAVAAAYALDKIGDAAQPAVIACVDAANPLLAVHAINILADARARARPGLEALRGALGRTELVTIVNDTNTVGLWAARAIIAIAPAELPEVIDVILREDAAGHGRGTLHLLGKLSATPALAPVLEPLRAKGRLRALYYGLDEGACPEVLATLVRMCERDDVDVRDQEWATQQLARQARTEEPPAGIDGPLRAIVLHPRSVRQRFDALGGFRDREPDAALCTAALELLRAPAPLKFSEVHALVRRWSIEPDRIVDACLQLLGHATERGDVYDALRTLEELLANRPALLADHAERLAALPRDTLIVGWSSVLVLLERMRAEGLACPVDAAVVVALAERWNAHAHVHPELAGAVAAQIARLRPEGHAEALVRLLDGRHREVRAAVLDRLCQLDAAPEIPRLSVLLADPFHRLRYGRDAEHFDALQRRLLILWSEDPRGVPIATVVRACTRVLRRLQERLNRGEAPPERIDAALAAVVTALAGPPRETPAWRRLVVRVREAANSLARERHEGLRPLREALQDFSSSG